MSGIAGVFNLDGSPADPNLLSAMSARLSHRGLDGEGTEIRGPFGAVCRLNRISPESIHETQPLADSSGNILVFDGRLDNREELLHSLGREVLVPKDLSDPDLLLAAYRLFGEGLPERLNGDYAFALFDPSKGKLFLVRDSLGVRPLHYAQVGNSLIFASEIKALLSHPGLRAEPNDDLLADFFIGQVYDQEITFFRNIYNVLPSHVRVQTSGGASQRRYWDFNPEERVRFETFEEYAKAFREVFERAVSRRIRSRHPVAVSLSGGLDSSSIFCLAEHRVRVGAASAPRIIGGSYITREGSPSDERVFLTDIERAYSVSIERFPMGGPGFFDGGERAIWHMEMPMADSQWKGLENFLLGLRDKGARVLLTGHWADQFLFPQAYLVDLARRLRWRTVYKHLKEYGAWMTDADPAWYRHRFCLDLVKYFSPSPLLNLLRKIRPGSRHPLYSRSLEDLAWRRRSGRSRIGLQFRNAHGRSLYEEARTGYHVLCMEWQNKVNWTAGLDSTFPFLDRDLISFLMAIPGEIQTYRGVPKALLRASMKGILPQSIAERRWKADFNHLVSDAAKSEFKPLANFISNGSAMRRGYLLQDGFSEAIGSLEEHVGQEEDGASWDLSEVASLEMWLRVFCPEATASSRGKISE